ncbi:Octanoyltransferase [Usitatibacter rugosus]|uniref:Octanoyltransferase n=1 Tax=Usitatibacter rugosus TaxID=2732067 RepID=A0A6M4H0N3_9PROT|nr:lipoyl(octanoyl) transferase LipB [Usitatibacter rugosus]QJR13066.1 Octanoyltransferase [Usitatibacter rugosus]
MIRDRGRLEYMPAWHEMQAFNRARGADTPDEIWLVEHPPVYTLGLAGRAEHVLAPGDIPVVKTDRGGQVTYHGPGQAIAYVLLDLKRLGIGAKELVRRLEASAIDVLGSYGLRGHRRDGMPGVYVEDAKVCAIGLRISRGCSYHGLAINVDLDLEPFSRIDPCGYPGLAATRLADLGVGDKIDAVQHRLGESLARTLA